MLTQFLACDHACAVAGQQVVLTAGAEGVTITVSSETSSTPSAAAGAAPAAAGNGAAQSSSSGPSQAEKVLPGAGQRMHMVWCRLPSDCCAVLAHTQAVRTRIDSESTCTYAHTFNRRNMHSS